MHDARVAAGSKLIGVETDHRAAYHKSFMEGVEADLAPMFRTMFGDMLEHPDVPEEAKAYLRPLLEPEHQGQFFLTLAALVGLALAGPAAAAAGWLQRMQYASMQEHGDTAIPMEAAAVGVVKGELTFEEAERQAQKSGMRADVFAALIAITGDPPGPQELQEALRRGYIDEARFAHGIRQGRTKDEWIDVLTRLRYAPVSAGEALAAAVQNHLSIDEATRHVSEAGVDPANFGWLYETHGRPPGIQELIQLWRRGAVDQATVEQAIRESDVKNKYIPAMLHFAKHVLPQRTVVSMRRHGVIDDARAMELFKEEGITGADADALLLESHQQRSQNVRDLTAAETVALYVEGIIDRTRALAMLSALHFSAEAGTALLQLADVKREHAAIAASVRRVHSAYVGHRIDRATTSTRLDALRLDAAARDQAITLWDEERAANVRPLTEAQIVRLRKADLIDDAEFVARHIAMGYTADDAALLLHLDFPATRGA
jgi:hypothetical protein